MLDGRVMLVWLETGDGGQLYLQPRLHLVSVDQLRGQVDGAVVPAQHGHERLKGGVLQVDFLILQKVIGVGGMQSGEFSNNK